MMTSRLIRILLICVLFTGQLIAKSSVAPGVEELKQLILGEKYNEAEKIVDQVITANVKDPEAYYWAGILFYTRAQDQEAQVKINEYNDKAKDYFSRGIKVKGKFAQNHVGMARVLYRQEKFEEAEKVFGKVTDLNAKNDPDINIEMALAYIEIKTPEKMKEAERLLLSAQDKDPKNPRTYVALGDYYYAKQIFALSLPQYEKAIEVDPEYILAYLRVGKIKIEEGNTLLKNDNKEAAQFKFKEGIEKLNTAVEKKPDFAPAYRERGELFFRATQYDKATADYEKYVELTDNDLKAKVRYISFLYLSNKHQKAIDMINVVKKDTITNVMRRLEAYSLKELGEFEKADAALQDYFNNMPDEYEITDDYLVKGGLMKEMAKYDEAKEAYMKAIEMDSTRSEKLLDELVEMYEKTAKDYKSALEIRKMIVKEKESLRNYLNLGVTAYYAKEYDQAVAAFDKVIEMKADYYVGYYWKASALSKIDKANDTFGSPVKSYEKVIELIDKEKESGEELSAAKVKRLKIALQYLAFYNFNPSGKDTEDTEYFCENAKPYVLRVLDMDAANKAMLNLSAYCEYEEVQTDEGSEGEN